jgi:predicted MPP superfamily phosphohydrolase
MSISFRKIVNSFHGSKSHQSKKECKFGAFCGFQSTINTTTMKKIFVLFLLAMLFSTLSFSQGNDGKPILKFNEKGKFRIAQFTDLHFQYKSDISDSTLALMRSVIVSEKPDLVVLTGDIVTSEHTQKAWNSLCQTFIDAKVPWTIVLGNHDIEEKMTGKEIIEAVGKMPYNLTSNGPENVSGNGNYVLNILSSKSSKTETVLYFLDSHSSFPKKHEFEGYDWIRSDQVEWYRNQSKIFTGSNGGKPMNALAFFHIPLQEYKEVLGKATTIGSQKENISCSSVNSGLFAAMLDTKDVMGMFVGHDHNNNYIGCLHHICLAFGNVTGRDGYGDIGKGARIIDLYEGARKFDTWILKMYECDRDKGTWIPVTGEREMYRVSYPKSFVKK